MRMYNDVVFGVLPFACRLDSYASIISDVMASSIMQSSLQNFLRLLNAALYVSAVRTLPRCFRVDICVSI